MTYPWTLLKPAVEDMYLRRNLTLEQVKEEIKVHYGYLIQNRTYREKVKEWKMRRQDAKHHHHSGDSAVTHNSSYAPGNDAFFPPGTGCPYALGPANSEMRVLCGPRSRQGTSTEVRDRSLSPNPEFAISEPKSRCQNSEQELYVPREAAMVVAGFQNRSEFTKNGLAATGMRQPLRPAPATELTSTQMETRLNMVDIQQLQLDFPENIMGAQTSHPFAGARPMIHTPPNPVTRALVPWSTSHECSLPNNISSASGRYMQCQNETCIYGGISLDMRVPALPDWSCPVASDHKKTAGIQPDVSGWKENPMAQSYPRAMPGSNIMQDVGGNFYASGAQSGISDPNSSDPSWTLISSQEETQPTSTHSVSNLLADQDNFLPSLEDPRLLSTDPPTSSYIGPTENVGLISHDLQSQDLSPDTQLDPMDPSNFNFIGNQMDIFSNASEKFYPVLDYPQFPDTGSHSLPHPNDSMWQGGNFDMAQAMNKTMLQAMITTTPQAATMTTPYAMNTATPYAMNTTTPHATNITTPHTTTMKIPHTMNMTTPHDMNMKIPQATTTNTTLESPEDAPWWPGIARQGKRRRQARSQRQSPY